MHFTFADTTIHVNVPHAAALLTAARARLTAREGFALATLNLDHLVKLSTDERFRAAYAAHDFIVADGNPVVWLSKLARQPVDLVPGSDMVVPLSRLAAQAGARVALLGSTEETLEAAAEELRTEVRGLDIALTLAPPMGFDPEGNEATRMLRMLEAGGINLCFVALGAPKQEILAARGRKLAPHVGFASIGAGLDFIAGQQARAPEWVQNMSMEWAWRMASDPRRLAPRYWACAKLLPGEARKAFSLRQQTG